MLWYLCTVVTSKNCDPLAGTPVDESPQSQGGVLESELLVELVIDCVPVDETELVELVVAVFVGVVVALWVEVPVGQGHDPHPFVTPLKSGRYMSETSTTLST